MSLFGELFSNPYILATLVYLFALLGVGVYKSKVVNSSDDFMVAGRTLPWYILVGTLLATWMGTARFLAAPASAIEMG